MLQFSTRLGYSHIFQALLQNEVRLIILWDILFYAVTAVVLLESYIYLCRTLKIKHFEADENWGRNLVCIGLVKCAKLVWSSWCLNNGRKCMTRKPGLFFFDLLPPWASFKPITPPWLCLDCGDNILQRNPHWLNTSLCSPPFSVWVLRSPS